MRKDFEVQGQTHSNTSLTKSFARRLNERRPLLLSPTNSSRPLSPNAGKVLDEQNLEIIQADKIQAKYSFERSSKHLKVTCCTKQRSRQKTTIYLTTNPDWFDIGSAIGALILQRVSGHLILLLFILSPFCVSDRNDFSLGSGSVNWRMHFSSASCSSLHLKR